MSKEERKFIHDLANPIAIAQGNIKLTIRKLTKDPSSLSSEQVIERLEKACDAFDRIGDMLAERRQFLVERSENEEEENDEAKAV